MEGIYPLTVTLTTQGVTTQGVTTHDTRGQTPCVTLFVAAEYTYDPFGKLLSTTTYKSHSVGEANPLRYKDYVYDYDTELYYLQSRYYDPEVGRFINADAFASTGQGVLSTNMFAYCNNDPIMLCDPYGQCPHDGRVYEMYSDTCPFCGLSDFLKSQGMPSLEEYKSGVGEYSLYDSKRSPYNKNEAFQQKFPVVDISGLMDPDPMFGFGYISALSHSADWNFEHGSISLFDVGKAEFGFYGAKDLGHFYAGAAITAYNPSVSIKVGTSKITLAGEFGTLGFVGENGFDRFQHTLYSDGCNSVKIILEW